MFDAPVIITAANTEVAAPAPHSGSLPRCCELAAECLHATSTDTTN
ncbi:hypothetical protein [Mycolicibacterium mageritense]|nr:hypothetical protein [Mycolicibacterium mageritense]MCC9184151.1 hypothetical protein [Mycolicibacterium mageritense]